MVSPNIPANMHELVKHLKLRAAVLPALLLVLMNANTFAQAREGYADLSGVRLWYKDTGGRGIPVVFLHANTGSSQNWDRQIPAFTAAGYRVIAYDRRGWGKSTSDAAPPGTAADDLHALMKSLG